MRIRYDSEVDAIYISLGKGEYLESEEIEDGVVVDFSKEGKVIGLEILNASAKLKELEKLKEVFTRHSA